MGAAQNVAAVAWGSVMAAPWAAWLLGESVRSPSVVAVMATSALIGLAAGLLHQSQTAAAQQAATDAFAREMAAAVAGRAEAERRAGEWQGRYREAARQLAALGAAPGAETEEPNVRGPFFKRVVD